MQDPDLQKYCDEAVKMGATQAKQIDPNSVVTAPWVRWKCQFGCPEYGKGYCCPPDSPTPEQTRAVIDSYRRAILFHLENPKTPDRGKRSRDFYDMLIDLEVEMFKDGYYKAFALVAGACRICKECAKLSGNPCNFGFRARPSMESCGIDVFQTVRNNGFFIVPLRERAETRNLYSLILVD
jgi:predicted metal-binding protein